MSKRTSKTLDLKNSTHAEEHRQNSSDELIKTKKVGELTLRTFMDNTFVTFGSVRHEKIFGSEEEAEEYVNNHPWEFIPMMIEETVKYYVEQLKNK